MLLTNSPRFIRTLLKPSVCTPLLAPSGVELPEELEVGLHAREVRIAAEAGDQVELHVGVEVDARLEHVLDVGGLDLRQRQVAVVPRAGAGVDEVEREDAAEVAALAAVGLRDRLVGGGELEEPEFRRQLGQLAGAGDGRFHAICSSGS